jgi:tetraacyldisaccharide 4'-kinase
LLDLLYAQAVGVRRRWYERHPQARRRLRRPVISVGNLSVGGTGKTPFAAHVVRWLLARGERPAILSRGYGRAERRDGVVVVSDGARVLADLATSGDEPLMLARALPGAVVAVAEDRYLAGLVAERRLGATVHVLDDGFQHLHLARDLDVLMTAPGEIVGGRVLPFGRLRESRHAAARAHAVVVMDTDRAGAKAEAWSLGISQAAAARRVVPPADAPGIPAVAIAGIAQPTRFFESLHAAGYAIAATLAFPDHHRYTPADIDRIATARARAGASTVLTTEKDAVRLAAIAALPFAYATVAMTLEIDGWDDLAALIQETLARVREVA